MSCCVYRQELGSLRLKVHFTEERILETMSYTPLVDLMVCSVERPLVSNVVDTLLNIYAQIHKGTHTHIHTRAHT